MRALSGLLIGALIGLLVGIGIPYGMHYYAMNDPENGGTLRGVAALLFFVTVPGCMIFGAIAGLVRGMKKQ